MTSKNPPNDANKSPGEMLSTIKERTTQKRTKADVLIYVALVLYLISTITGIILIFIIASVFFMCWALLKTQKSHKKDIL